MPVGIKVKPKENVEHNVIHIKVSKAIPVTGREGP
jgi:hypothetical protein